MTTTCEACAHRERGLYLAGCATCQARHLARLMKRDRQAAYQRAAELGEDVEALKRRVRVEWELDHKGEAK